MAKKATAKKSAKKSSTPKVKGGAREFVDYIHKDRKMRATIKKGWDAVIAEGKKQGYRFSKQELHDHLKKRYNVTSSPEGDEPDTCICF